MTSLFSKGSSTYASCLALLAVQANGINPKSSSCPQSTSNYRVDNLTYFDYDSSDLPCMYAGNMQSSDTLVNNTYNNFFFWYFPNPDSDNMPLVLYMNGGPGATSMTALFEANGPLTVTQTDSEDQDSYKISYNAEDSWTFLGDLLFIDQPVGTGWSYGYDKPESLPAIADEILNWFTNYFYVEFPELKSKQLVLTGESFAGKYIPFLAQAILTYNSQVESADDKIDIRIISLSDPLVDVETERMNQHRLAYATGLYDEGQSAQVELLRNRCETNINDESVDLDTREDNCKDILNYVAGFADRSHFDIRYFSMDDHPPYTYNKMFLYSSQLDLLKSDLHITKQHSFQKSSTSAHDHVLDRLEDTAWIYSELLQQGMKILINIGEFDQDCGIIQTFDWTKAIDLGDEREDFDTQARSIYKYMDNENEWQYGGYFRQSTNFTLITVPKAGHMVPVTMEKDSGMFVSDLIQYGQLRCPTNQTCKTFASEMCSYMNDCSGHGSCSDSTGQCACDSGYFGADCSVETTIVDSDTDGSFMTAYTTWQYFQISEDTGANFLLNFYTLGSQTFDVYIMYGMEQVPDPSNFDFYMRGQTQVTFNQQTFNCTQGFMLAIYVKLASGSDNVTVQYQNLVASNNLQGDPNFTNFIAAAASPKAEPSPMFQPPPYYDPPTSAVKNFDTDDSMMDISNFIYMIIGTVFGWLGTYLFYKCASRRQNESSNQILQNNLKHADPNHFLTLGVDALGRPMHHNNVNVLFDADEEKDELYKVTKKK